MDAPSIMHSSADEKPVMPPMAEISQPVSWDSMATVACVTGNRCVPLYPPNVGTRDARRSRSTPQSAWNVSLVQIALAPARSTARTNARVQARWPGSRTETGMSTASQTRRSISYISSGLVRTFSSLAPMGVNGQSSSPSAPHRSMCVAMWDSSDGVLPRMLQITKLSRLSIWASSSSQASSGMAL